MSAVTAVHRRQRHHRRHAGPQVFETRLTGIKGDLDRNALDDAREVASRVVGRQERELRAAGRRKALDTPPERYAGDAVDRLPMTLSPICSAGICVSLKLATTQNSCGHDRDQESARAHILSDPGLPLADPAVDGRPHGRIFELDLGKPEGGGGGVDIRLKLRALALQHVHLPPRGRHVRLRFGDLCASPQMVGFRLLAPRLRSPTASGQLVECAQNRVRRGWRRLRRRAAPRSPVR